MQLSDSSHRMSVDEAKESAARAGVIQIMARFDRHHSSRITISPDLCII